MGLKHLIPNHVRSWLYWRRANAAAVVKKIGHRLGFSKFIWRRALPSEVSFWEGYLSTRGRSSQAEAEFIFRTSPESELQPWLKNWMNLPAGRPVRILDVGAGPLTWVGKKWGDHELQIEAVDPLAEMYDEILNRQGIVPPVRTKKGDGENIAEIFGREVFDMTFARNCLDHAYDAIKAVSSMVEVTKPGGIVCLWHIQDEAEKSSYLGLHQWNFRLHQGELLVWNGSRKLNVNRDFPGRLQVLKCEMEGDMIQAIYRKL